MTKGFLSQENSLELAQKYLTKCVYSCAKLTNINVTLHEVQAILDDINVCRISQEQKTAIKNLQKAWQYALENLSLEPDLDFLRKINSIVLSDLDSDAGQLRAKPNEKNLPPPDPAQTAQDLENMLKIEDPIDKAIEYFIYGCKNQLFSKGVKRTMLIAANFILIKNDAGLMLIQDKDLVDYSLKSLYFYNTGKNKPLKEFLRNCVIAR
ncbi:MAG TPA: Fic family protein [Clostridia bacterium]